MPEDSADYILKELRPHEVHHNSGSRISKQKP